ncbi:hypothetical protein EO087_06130 [Dyella sp. M7H15-1]|uniref:hypothetical protein n=1 Tax=Dyella sp. M7H15-1 TaxID=2501295 RepID=UPI001004F423|nr:hypothetical protein [Dyella sp. M7H15-1]QAU23612.1 hypothetical protein EO087_06130 [Dyella sp. M7H15-1]
MSLDAAQLFALMPAVYRDRDAANGGPLQALFAVLASQSAIVEHNIQQLYDDQFIETCAPWVIPYIGDLIGYNSIYQTRASVDSRAEVANTIGYRRRKGTQIALQQVAMDVSGRAAVIVEAFKRLIVNESMRHPRPHHDATLNLRHGLALSYLDTAFDTSSRTIDVRRIAPRIRTVADPDPVSLDIDLHGPGRFNIPDIAVYLWRWKNWLITRAAAYVVDARRFHFHALGVDTPLFSQPPVMTAPFSRLNTRVDVPQPIGREEFARRMSAFYGPSLMLYADGVPVDIGMIRCANLADRPGGAWCTVAAGKIAIDPELGRIQYAADLQPPQSLCVSYNYGFPAAIGGGPYDRSSSLEQQSSTQAPAQADFFAQVGTVATPTLEAAVTLWNLQPAGTTGIIVLAGFARYAIDLTGANAIQMPSGSGLAIVAAEPVPAGGPREVIWNQACVTLDGNLQITGTPGAGLPEGETPPPGQLLINGVWIAGQLRIDGAAVSVQIADTTLVPGLDAASPGLSAGEPSITLRGDSSVCLARCISGPIYADIAGSVRICGSIVDATSPCCVAYAGADGCSAGADLHVEDSTVIGKLHTRTLRLASNTIFFARTGCHDPWPAAIWCSRRQVGCVRFCYLPFDSITPRRYECLPPDADRGRAFDPTFITLRFGHPSYALLSGDVPMAIWTGADNGSQIGVYDQIQETQAVSNVRIRTPEYLPVSLQSGIFLNPSRSLLRPRTPPLAYGYGVRAVKSCCDGEDGDDGVWFGIGVGLL